MNSDLAVALSENRRLRKSALDGEKLTGKEELDDRDREKVDRPYRKYVFVRGA
jgi:hypothetical protein